MELNGWIFHPSIYQAIASYIKCPFTRLILSWTCRRGYKIYHDAKIVEMWHVVSAQKVEQFNPQTGRPLTMYSSVLTLLEGYLQKSDPTLSLCCVGFKCEGCFVEYAIDVKGRWHYGTWHTNHMLSLVFSQYGCSDANDPYYDVPDMLWRRFSWSIIHDASRKLLLLMGKYRRN